MVAIAYASYVPLSIQTLFGEFNTRFPNRSRRSDGLIGDSAHQSRPSDHNIGANGKIHAGDITHDPAHGCDIHREVRTNDILRDPRQKYIISNGKMLSSYSMGMYPAYAERPYSGSNAHRQHAHVSIKSGRVYENDTTPWYGVSQEEKLDAETKAKFEEVDKDFAEIKKLLGPNYGLSISTSLFKARRDENGNPIIGSNGKPIFDEHLNLVERKVDELAMHIGEVSVGLRDLAAAVAALADKVDGGNGG